MNSFWIEVKFEWKQKMTHVLNYIFIITDNCVTLSRMTGTPTASHLPCPVPGAPRGPYLHCGPGLLPPTGRPGEPGWTSPHLRAWRPPPPLPVLVLLLPSTPWTNGLLKEWCWGNLISIGKRTNKHKYTNKEKRLALSLTPYTKIISKRVTT